MTLTRTAELLRADTLGSASGMVLSERLANGQMYVSNCQPAPHLAMEVRHHAVALFCEQHHVKSKAASAEGFKAKDQARTHPLPSF